MVDVNPVISRLPTYPAEALYAKRDELRRRGIEVFDFSVGDPIEPTDPRIRAAFGNGMPEVSRYPKIRGIEPLRQAIARWLRRRFDVELDPEREILPTRGSKEAIFHLPLAFCDPAKRPRIIFGNPGYPPYERGALFAGAEPWPVELRPERGYRLEPWHLPADEIAKTAVIWINYPHNPTGATVDEAYLRRVIDFCHDHDILLCADECYVDMYLDDIRPPSVLQLADGSGSRPAAGVLAFHSLSKRSGMTGYRAGFVAGHAELVATLVKMRANLGVAATVPGQQAAIVAWDDEEHAARRRDAFRAKRDAFVTFFADAGLEHLPCRATLYLWVRIPPAFGNDGAAAMAYGERLTQAGILVAPAPLAGVDQPYIRLALVPSLADCQRAIELWKSIPATPTRTEPATPEEKRR